MSCRSRRPQAVAARSGDAPSRARRIVDAIVRSRRKRRTCMAGCARQTATSPVGDVVYLSLTGQCAPATPALRNIEVARGFAAVLMTIWQKSSQPGQSGRTNDSRVCPRIPMLRRAGNSFPIDENNALTKRNNLRWQSARISTTQHVCDDRLVDCNC